MEIVETNRANFLDNDRFSGSFRQLDICFLEDPTAIPVPLPSIPMVLDEPTHPDP